MVLTPSGNWYYCAAQVPSWLLCQLQDRGDNQIPVLEALAVVMGLHTFQSMIESGCVTAFCDNNCVLQSFLKGTSRATEVNMMCGRLWLEMAKWEVGLHLLRVSSKSNPSDGPSRGNYELAEELKMTRVAVIWPEWLTEIMEIDDYQ